jgi:uncharacterized protein
MEIKEDKFNILVKSNSNKNEIVCFDSVKQAYVVRIKAPAIDNKANIEIVKFLSKKLGKKVRILKGLRSKTKIIEII